MHKSTRAPEHRLCLAKEQTSITMPNANTYSYGINTYIDRQTDRYVYYILSLLYMFGRKASLAAAAADRDT